MYGWLNTGCQARLSEFLNLYKGPQKLPSYKFPSDDTEKVYSVLVETNRNVSNMSHLKNHSITHKSVSFWKFAK